jgi:3-methylcrotonyl-CoA carboxylase alpha subunit
MRLRCGDEEFDVQVRESKGTFEARVGERLMRFGLEPAGPGVFVVRDGTRASTLHLAADGATLHLSWDGVAYTLFREREGARAAHRQDAGALQAPMPGRVAVVRVVPGQHVARGEELLVVEAMKMENAMRAPRNGVVRAVHVAAGDLVGPGRSLVEIE